jgi:hypothetical protein
MVKLSDLKKNPNNPRHLSVEKFEKLKQSIIDFPKMMELRPIVVDDDNIILGGNMRFSALKALGYKDIPNEWVKYARELTDSEKRQFIIKDNVSFGLWDNDALANEWELDHLLEWGLDLWDVSEDEALEEEEEEESEQEDKEEELVVKIKINKDHLEEINELIAFWKDRKAYVGGLLLEKLRNEKSKLK